MQLYYSAACFKTHVVLHWRGRNASSEGDPFLFVPLLVAVPV